MRTIRPTSACVLLLAGLVGCGPRQEGPTPAPLLTPIHHELASLTIAEPTIGADVAVAGAPAVAPGEFVGSMQPPELTADERAKLGPEPKKIDFLALYERERGGPDGVLPLVGGVTTASHGTGAAVVSRGAPPTQLFGLGPSHEHPQSAFGYPSRRVANHGPGSSPVGASGPAGDITIGIAPPTKLSSHKPRVRP
ncbi:MAG: hypothetical protein AB7Q17_16730 [Phycisphaerae bacterium]